MVAVSSRKLSREAFPITFHRPRAGFTLGTRDRICDRDADAPDHHYIGTIEDITDRKQAEQASHDIREQLEQLASHIPEALWIMDLGKRSMIYTSPGFDRIHDVHRQLGSQS